MFDCKEKSGYRYELSGRQGNYRDTEWITWYEEYTFEFDSRVTYLEFRQWWKDQYKRISQEIRDTRRDLKNKARAGEYVANEQYLLGTQQANARRFMGAIEAAKQEAARQVEAERKAA